MATNNEIVTDPLWEEMKNLAIEQQQCFYELLSECTEYQSNEHKFLRQNIGFAIYGPMNNENASTTESTENASTTENNKKSEDSIDTDADITDTILTNYDEKAINVIDKIYKKICECTIETNNTQLIYFGIIYNVIFRPKMDVNPKKEEVKEEMNKETETEITEPIKEEEKESPISSIPIFTIRRHIQKESDTLKSSEQKENIKAENKADYEVWYIDIGARVYKSWINYIESNTLPKCTMVLPKDGFYQADVSYPVTEDYSTVWLEITESPACTWTSAICSGVDIASGVVGLGTAGLCVAGLFTPLAPVAVVTGLIATGASSIWTIGRSSQQLADRITHEESILDPEALPYWLGIFGTTFGLGALGGSAALSSAVAQGKTIPTFVKLAFNTVQGGNLLLNGVGIVYQGYYIVDKYLTDKSQISSIDVLNFAIHVMFFAGTVIKIQFANDIIESTQGKVINDYKENLRKRNLRKKFNRIVRRAAENNTNKISENADVIKYIRHREQILSANQPVNQLVARQKLDKITNHIVWSFEHGKLRVNGIILLDPIEYVVRLIRSDIFNEIQNNSSTQNNVDNAIADQLKETFADLLTKFYLSDACPRSKNLPLLPDFEPLLKDMNSMKINEECLKKLFKIVGKLMKRCRDKSDFLLSAFILVWQYCKANLTQWGIYTRYRIQSSSGSNILQKIIITAVSEAIDMILDNLCSAFARYVEITLMI